MQEPQEHELAPVHHRDVGNGRPVLFVHGWMVSGRVWDRVLPLLADYRAIVPDLRGSGATPARSGAVTLDGHVADLVALCDSLDLRGTHLVGHSMGGQLALLLAAKAPQYFDTLTLLNPVPVQGLAFPDALQPLFRDCGGKEDDIARIVDMSCRRIDDAGRTMLIDDGMRTSPAAISAGFESFRRGAPDVALDGVLPPTTVVATDDPFLPADFLQESVVARLSGARLVHLPGPGHYPQVETPGPTARLLQELLA